MSNIEDRVVESRQKQIFGCTRHDGWKHIQEMFHAKIAELKNIESIASYKDEDKLKMITIHIEVAQRLQELLNEIEIAAQEHENVQEPIRVYGAEDFGE